MQRIRDLIHKHALPLSTLGAGAGSLLHRFIKMLHGFRLESDSFATTAKLIAGTRAISTDAGTEAGLWTLLPHPMRELLPWFRDVDDVEEPTSKKTGGRKKPKHDEIDLEEDDFLHPPKRQKNDDIAMADITGAVWIDGPLHQLSNAAK